MLASNKEQLKAHANIGHGAMLSVYQFALRCCMGLIQTGHQSSNSTLQTGTHISSEYSYKQDVLSKQKIHANKPSEANRAYVSGLSMELLYLTSCVTSPATSLALIVKARFVDT